MRHSSAPVAAPGMWSVREALERVAVGTVASLGSGWVSRDTMPASIISISGFDAVRAGFVRLWRSILPRFGGLSVTRRLRHILFYLRRLLIIHYVPIPSTPEN